MLAGIDRVQLATADRASTADAFRRLLGAEVVREDAVAPLAARRTTLAVGTSAIELLEPDGAGAVDAHLRHLGPGLFAAGFAVEAVAALRARLVARAISFAEADEQLFLAPIASGDHGLRCVVSPLRERVPVGLASHLYEVTNLVRDYAAASAGYAALFGLAPERFCAIESTDFGYRGVLTLFDDARLDRVECITPYDATKTMGRFMAKRGECLYMCFVEAPDLGAIIARLEEHAPHDWSAAPGGEATDTLFVHPQALAGLLLGVSRTSVGWSWSGHPERVDVADSTPPP
jgi:catechol 2,3-dioxygenase-like lactoylglutathione lyase family enzyme